ncbi:acetylglutamate kinase [Paenibacillus sp. HJGM_3]|uniref:acetylglutamate kinase n=1 Tax=Paenibacillus sp. HJGM_3 TaxID=3379816 RepID=UPI00385F15A0
MYSYSESWYYYPVLPRNDFRPDSYGNPGSHTMSIHSGCISKHEDELSKTLRELWEQHVFWTRLAIVSIVFQLPDVSVTLSRLLRNATDMGNAIRPFYGDEAAKKFEQLIRDHLVIAADLVKAAVAGNQSQVNALEKKWYANADDVTNFLASANPYFPKEAFRKMFYHHLALTKAEAVTMIGKDYAQSIALFDQIEKEALIMADMMTKPIVAQFPAHFR